MINIDSLTDADHGRWVVYRHGTRNDRGRILRWNPRFVFVVYWCDGQWDDYAHYTAAPTFPSELEFE
jgi:hypothetical protein